MKIKLKKGDGFTHYNGFTCMNGSDDEIELDIDKRKKKWKVKVE